MSILQLLDNIYKYKLPLKLLLPIRFTDLFIEPESYMFLLHFINRCIEKELVLKMEHQYKS